MKNKLDNELKKLEVKIEKAEMELKALRQQYDNKVTNNFSFCSSSWSYKKFNLKKKRIVELKNEFKPCNKRFPKEDFKYVIIEDYCTRLTILDGGWGDDDSFSWVHTFTKCKVCQNCGAMLNLGEIVADTKGSWLRWEWDERKDEIKRIGDGMKPKDRKGKRVVYCGDKKGYDKMLNTIKNTIF